jgi:hypothetical protein
MSQGRNLTEPEVVVTQIRVTLVTGDVPDAQTNGEVYLVVGGREFNIKRPDIDDRQRAATDVYRLGQGANIDNARMNDPRKLVTKRLLERYPVGLRFEPVPNRPPAPPDAWNLASATMAITSSDEWRDEFVLDDAHKDVWLGFHTGLVAAFRYDRLVPPGE